MVPMRLTIARIAFANRADTLHDLVLGGRTGGSGWGLLTRTDALARGSGRNRGGEHEGKGGGE